MAMQPNYQAMCSRFLYSIFIFNVHLCKIELAVCFLYSTLVNVGFKFV